MKMPKVACTWLAPVAVLISLLVVPASYAAPPADDTRVTSASGSLGIVASVPQRQEVVDGQLLFQVRNTIDFTGTLAGTSLCVTSGRVNLSTGQGRGRVPESGGFRADGSWGESARRPLPAELERVTGPVDRWS
jgi:hypothetical protein